MMGSSKRLLAGIVGIVLLVLAGTPGKLISGKKKKNIFRGLGTYLVPGEGKNLGKKRGKGGKTNTEKKEEKNSLCKIYSAERKKI